MCGHDLVCRTRLQGSELGLKAGSNSLGSAITMTRRPDDRLGPQRLSRSFLARYRRTSAGADENDKCENRMQLTFGRARPSVCPYGLDSGHYFSHVPNGRSGSSSADHLRQHAAHLPPFTSACYGHFSGRSEPDSGPAKPVLRQKHRRLPPTTFAPGFLRVRPSRTRKGRWPPPSDVHAEALRVMQTCTLSRLKKLQ